MNDWITSDLKYNWHPYTQMKECESFPPLLIERGEGLKLFDADGNWYYDTISSWWCNVHGHNHPHIMEAIRRQTQELDHVLFAGFTHRGAIELARRLATIAPPGLERVFYSDNGSTAVEVALKMSLQYRQNTGQPDKREFVAFDMGYHGDTIGAMSVSGVDLFNRRFSPLFFSAHKVPTPYCYRCPAGQEQGACRFECLHSLEALLARRHEHITAMIIEPLVLGAAGMVMYPPECLNRIRELTGRYDVQLILDEVAVGFGRTGTMFACEQAEVIPDFLCLSKGITGGTLPLAATLTSDRVYRAFYDEYDAHKTFYHGHTYTANPLACAAACAALDVFEREATLENVRTLAPQLRQGVERLQRFAMVDGIRTCGLIAAMELVCDRRSRQPLSPARPIALALYREGLRQGIILRPLGHVVYIFLPLAVTERNLSDILARLERTFESVV